MSHYCQQHPRYEAKRRPSGACKKCWALYFLKNPEEKTVVLETYEELVKMQEDFH